MSYSDNNDSEINGQSLPIQWKVYFSSSSFEKVSMLQGQSKKWLLPIGFYKNISLIYIYYE